MTILFEKPDRRFQLWSFRVSHGMLLLRSLKDPTHPTRVDVMFRGVELIQLPTALDGLSMESVSGGDATVIFTANSVRPSDLLEVFRLRGIGYSGHVIATAFRVSEDEAEYDDPSQLSLDLPIALG